jgi:hypothetical protein
VDGYVVRRYVAGGGAEEPVGDGCSGTLAAPACTEALVPDGTWAYTVTPVLASDWRGAESPASLDILVDTAPEPLARSGSTDVMPPMDDVVPDWPESTPAPAGGSVTVAGLGEDGTATSLTLVLTLDPGPGLQAGARLTRAGALLDADLCGEYGEPAEVVIGEPATTVSDTVPDDVRCYRYTYAVPDQAGNIATYMTPDVKVDTGAGGVEDPH